MERRGSNGDSTRWAARLGPWFVLLCALAPYVQTRDAPHVHDDHALRGPGSLVRDARTGPAELWTADFFGSYDEPRGHTVFWRPLVLWSFWIEARLAGASWAGYVWLGHVVTILIHAAACLALWALLRALRLPEAVALVASCAFALHPVHVETVAWISGRVASLATGLAWGGTALWLGRPDRRLPAVVAVALFTLALLSKETAVLLLGLAALLARLQGRSWRGAVAVPGTALLVALGLRALFVGLQPDVDPSAYAGPTAASARWFTWLSILPDLLRLSVWPGAATPLHPVLPATTWDAPGVLAGAMLLVLLVLSAGLAWRRRSLVGCLAAGLVLGTVVLLAPWARYPTGFPEVAGPLYERYLYGASLAPGLLLAWALRRPLTTSPVALLALLALLVALLVPVTRTRTLPWSSDEAFARAGLTLAPGSPNLWNHLGAARLEAFQEAGRQEDAEEALAAFERALALEPDHLRAAVNRFVAVGTLGQDARAEHEAERLLERWPDEPLALHNVAVWHGQHGRLEDAAALFEQELGLPGAHVQTRALLAATRRALAVRAPPPDVGSDEPPDEPGAEGGTRTPTGSTPTRP